MFPFSRLRPAPLTIMVLGSILVSGPLMWYQINVGSSSAIATREIGALETAAFSALGLIFVGLTLAFLGLTLYLRGISLDKRSGASGLIIRLSTMIAGRRSGRIFMLTTLAYGLFFGIVSSTLVFQPGIVFSEAYGVRVPSVVPVVCCGSFGQMPQLVVYLTQQFAILIIPSNLILLFALSWLSGLNAATASYSYVNRTKMAGGMWLRGLGAFIGLFTVCPTCAGLFFMETLGLGAVAGVALALSSLQTVFISIGIPILIITPILTTRRLSNIRTCSVENSVNKSPSKV